MIDARTHHDPAKAPGLANAAVKACGTQAEAARRLGISRRYLSNLQQGKGNMSYALQVALESLSQKRI